MFEKLPTEIDETFARALRRTSKGELETLRKFFTNVRIGEHYSAVFTLLNAEQARRDDLANAIRLEGGGACPEQYDAFIGERQAGYLRMRHGFFRVDYPDCGGETIYEASPRGDGEFAPHERAYFLAEAKLAIVGRIEAQQQRDADDKGDAP
jgi:hypothetical protein